MPAEPRGSKLMWLLLPLVALVGGLVWYPLHQQNRAVERRIERADQELAATRRTAERRERISKQIGRMRDRLRTQRQNIPDEPKLTELFASLTGAIESLGLRDPDISSGSIERRPNVRTMPIRLTFRGGAVDAFDLLRRIEDMPRLIQPTMLMMQAPPQGGGSRREDEDEGAGDGGGGSGGVLIELQLQAFFHDEARKGEP